MSNRKRVGAKRAKQMIASAVQNKVGDAYKVGYQGKDLVMCTEQGCYAVCWTQPISVTGEQLKAV